jgi:DNA repair protein RadD
VNSNSRPLTHKRKQLGPRLYPFQLQCISDLSRAYDEHSAPILQAATGAGKTVMLAEIVKRSPGQRILILVHRRELIRQASNKLTAAGMAHGILAPGFEPNPAALVQVASIQTAARRGVEDFDLVVFDECHHTRAKTWRGVVDMLPNARILGLTATSMRRDGKGLGVKHGGIFDAMVCGPPIAELIEDGHLSRVRCFAPTQQIGTTGLRVTRGDFERHKLAASANRAVITGDAVAEYRKHADHQSALAFCVTVEHAQRVAAAFRAAGYRAQCVHGGLPIRDRDRLIEELGTGDLEVLTSSEILGEGFDVPTVGAVILLRPTMSLTVYLQQVGRGMRPAPGKRELVVLDHAGNVRRHGLPDHDRVWTLDGVEERRAGEARVKTCPDCRLIVAVSTQRCPCCGHVFFLPRLETAAGTLTEVRADAEPLAPPFKGRGLSMAELGLIAEQRGYKPEWVWHRLGEQRRLVRARRAARSSRRPRRTSKAVPHDWL